MDLNRVLIWFAATAGAVLFLRAARVRRVGWAGMALAVLVVTLGGLFVWPGSSGYVGCGLLAVLIGCSDIQSPGSAVQVTYDRRPTIMEVAPPDMHQAFLQQYHLNPDKRFIGAFLYLVQELLLERERRYFSNTKGSC